MTLGNAIQLLRISLLQILVVAGPILIVSMAVGLIVAIFQATTSLQDQTISFIPKIVAVMFTIFILGPWMAQVFLRYANGIFGQISTIVR